MNSLLNFLVPGTYHVEVEHAGFAKAVQSRVIVDASGTNPVGAAIVLISTMVRYDTSY
jgi:hypothetical protein